MLALPAMLFGDYAAYIWSSYALALGALLGLWILSFRRRRTLLKTLAVLEPPSQKK